MEHDANIIKNIEMKEREKLNEKIFQLTKENERLQIELQGEDD